MRRDLTQFPDFPEVAERFKKSALLTFRFRDKVFALPEVQSFPCCFLLKDILMNGLGISDLG